MIERYDSEVRVSPENGRWEAIHSAEAFGGPVEIRLDGEPILQNSRIYIDDLSDESAVLRRLRDFRKGGAAVVSTEGYLPFGHEVSYTQTCRYAGNHMRVTLDMHWPRGMTVKRHLGIGGLFLPGKWTRMFCLPPASHLAAGQAPQWQDLPEAGDKAVMAGHWHRPPLVLVFEREDGTAVEIGTGTDVWRWEDSLGYGQECGSYKVMVTEEGIQVIREPLMCCNEYEPACRNYRFSWYVAWRSRDFPGKRDTASGADSRLLTLENVSKQLAEADGSASLVVDVAGQQWPDVACRVSSDLSYVKGERQEASCWESPVLQKRMRRLIRQLGSEPAIGSLIFKNVLPGPCWDPAHLSRKKAEGLVHWDMAGILDFAVWARKQLGEECCIYPELSGVLAELPSMQGLFLPNGFEGELFIADD